MHQFGGPERDRCLLGQYFSDAGFRDIKMGSALVTHTTAAGRVGNFLPPGFNEIAHGYGPDDRTFGAALERARAIAARS